MADSGDKKWSLFWVKNGDCLFIAGGCECFRGPWMVVGGW
jgi:hypothetical protein